MPHATPTVQLRDAELVDKALESAHLRPPDAPPALGAGSTAHLRSRMARFAGSAEHAERRRRVDAMIAGIDPSAVAVEAMQRTRAFEPQTSTALDAVQLAATLPTMVLATTLGWRREQLVGVADDVAALAGAIGRGEPATSMTDAAVDRLLAAAASCGDDPDTAVSLLYQNCDATKAYLLNLLAADLQGVERLPSVKGTVRVVDAATALAGTGGDPVVLDEGTRVELDLECGQREFGHGPHACPGRELADSIANSVHSELRTSGWTAITSLERTVDGVVSRLILSRS